MVSLSIFFSTFVLEVDTGDEKTEFGIKFVTGSTSFTDTIIFTSSIDLVKISYKCFNNKTYSWNLDSGASNNMTFHKSSLINIVTLPYPMLIYLLNGYKVK